MKGKLALAALKTIRVRLEYCESDTLPIITIEYEYLFVAFSGTR